MASSSNNQRSPRLSHSRKSVWLVRTTVFCACLSRRLTIGPGFIEFSISSDESKVHSMFSWAYLVEIIIINYKNVS